MAGPGERSHTRTSVEIPAEPLGALRPRPTEGRRPPGRRAVVRAASAQGNPRDHPGIAPRGVAFAVKTAETPGHAPSGTVAAHLGPAPAAHPAHPSISG